MPDLKDAEKQIRLDDVRRILSRHVDAHHVVGFAEALFWRGAAEDIAPYTASELAAIATASWELYQGREPGRHRITIANPSLGVDGGTRQRDVTVIEIVNDDMPFLVDSVMGELAESGLEIRLVLHPILSVSRQVDGRLIGFEGTAGTAANGATRESLIHIHVAKIVSQAERTSLAERIDAALVDVRRAVVDWRTMLARLDSVIDAYRTNPPPLPVDEIAEAVQFLQWLRDDNFTFLGTRDYRLEIESGEERLERIDETALGVLRDSSLKVLRRGTEGVNASREMAGFLRSPRPLVVTKSNVPSRIHRRIDMDYVGVKLFSAAGELSGELRIVGLFTSTAYTRSTRTIPYIRHKVDRTIAQAGFDPVSHSGKVLLNVLESYPRDELFQLDEATVSDFAMQIMALDEHPRVRVLARRDTFDRFVSVLVYVPRDRYSTDVRIRIGEQLENAFDGRVSSYQPSFPEGTLARVHFVIARAAGTTPQISQEALEATVTSIVRTWSDALGLQLSRTLDATRSELALTRYARAFGPAYREAYSVETAVSDIRVLERLDVTERVAIDFYRNPTDPPAWIALKLYSSGAPIPLSDRVPVLENMGLRVIDERTYRIDPAGLGSIYLHDMSLVRADGSPVDLTEVVDARIEALFMAVWGGRAENDGFNWLSLAAELGWREIALLRAYARYLRQIGIPYAQDYISGTLTRQPDIAALIVRLFRHRFDPDLLGDRAALEAEAIAAIEAALDAVTSLDDDTILRRFLNVVRATVRANYFQLDANGHPRETFAFKIESRQITAMPEPKPFREIWVYSPRVEGIHTRFGKVARGGLRWSDRPQDFRTEVLGLVKAQQVKNAVIVPVGAKGGFLPKWLKPGMPRDAWLAEGTAAYEIFVSSLLTVTDNLGVDRVLPPERVVRHEGDDPYLVVAADKGTATFSDTANRIAEAHGFWLGDAFASGGSAGYDHKKMGITARGAFEAVKRHFREMDVDILTKPFTVVGVGDMSGDVFGNGMLLAPTIRLIAAFDHRDIFIDPNPDIVASFAERRRLFELPRSSWADYDSGIISPGGGVFSRSAKSIELSEEARLALGFDQERATPREVMRAILAAPADLLWFGGIGTYVRATSESDAEVGDKANDAIRVTADEVQARVIGEGANLGVTQRARIAFGMRGGRCNSDAIDNSAGVNSSDLEVNIKIALGGVERAGLLTRADRNVLLASMTDAVAGLVLSNNYRQTLAISLTERRGMEDFGYQARFMQALEREGLLNRAVEVLPNDEALAQREKAMRPLSRAEIGVLLAYAKLVLKDRLLETEVPDEPTLTGVLHGYFPPRLAAEYSEAIDGHRLRREIIATSLVNAMIDAGGPTLATRIADQTGADIPAITRAFIVARETFGLGALDREIDALDGQVPGGLQLDLYAKVQALTLDGIVWFLRNGALGGGVSRTLGSMVERFRLGMLAIGPRLLQILPASIAGAARLRSTELQTNGVPATLADRISVLDQEARIPDIVIVGERAGVDLDTAAKAYFAVADRFRIAALIELSRAIPIGDYYDGLALDRARGMLADAHRRIAAVAFMAGDGLDGWLTAHGGEVQRTLAAVGDITQGDVPSVSRFAVAAGMISDLAR